MTGRGGDRSGVGGTAGFPPTALPPKSVALAGLRVCDLSGILAGAGATRLLAAFGAQVIRVEDPVKKGRWDITRGSAPFVDERRGVNLGGVFNNHNVEKLGVTLNLREEEGRDLFFRLVAISDVVTENFSAGVMDRLGLGFDRLKEVNDRVIYVSNSGFGKTGPYSQFKTFGPIVQAVSGLTFTAGLPGLPPAGWGYSYMDHMGADFMAFAILAALVNRNRTGKGAVHRSLLHRRWSHAGRARVARLHGEQPPDQGGRDRGFQLAQHPDHGSPRHLPGGGRGFLGGDRLPRRRRLATAQSRGGRGMER